MEEMELAYHAIADNVSLIEEEMRHEINDIVVSYGKKTLKKVEKNL